jgi:asparagine synthase (glutamine-hydrolysing)
LADEVSAHRGNNSNGKLSLGRRSLTKVKEVLPKGVKNRLRSAAYLVKNSARPYLHKDFFSAYAKYSYHHDALPADTLGEALHRSTAQGGLEELLRYADRNSMAHSREVRLPFLSHELVEFVFSLPSEFKIRAGITKYIMRRAFSDLIPEGILNRRDKIGYEPPQANWLQDPSMKEAIAESHKRLKVERILDTGFNFDQVAGGGNSAGAWKLLMAGMLLGE